jgi:hypothetical protein
MQSKQLQHQSLFYSTVATAIYYIETMNHHVNVKPNKKVLIMEWKQEYTIKDMNISVLYYQGHEYFSLPPWRNSRLRAAKNVTEMSNYKPFEILLNSRFDWRSVHLLFYWTQTSSKIRYYIYKSQLILFKARQIFHIIFVESILITYCTYYVYL